MKTNRSKATVMILSFLALCLGVVSCYDDTALLERIEALETTKIATINQQIDAIKGSITDLEATDKELDAAIAAIIKEDAVRDERIKSLNDSIAELQATDEAIQAEIASMAQTIQNLIAQDGEFKEQIAEIENAIAELRAVDTALQAEIVEIKETLQALAERDERFQADVDSLKAKDIALDIRINELKAYTDSISSATKDWANTTFSTLEQYQATCDELAAIKVLIAEQEASITKALNDAIATSESSIKGWVNEQLTGYWTIAETQAKLDTIKTNTDKEVAAIKADLKAAKEELTAAYKSEIAKAITDSEGKLSAKIDEINSALDKRIGAIEARLDAIEEKLNNLTREFAIEFDDTEIGIMPGGTSSVSYTITGATETTIVKALGQNGWNAKVTPNGTDKGTITVTAPNPMSNDEIIVLVYDGEFRTIMSTINFVTGIVIPSQTAVELEAEASTIEITVTSNLNYKVSIPEDAKNWLSLVETRATKTETITFACTANEFTIRQTEISFIDDANNVFTKVSVVQQGSVTEVTLTEAGSLLDAIGPDFVHKIKSLKVNGPINGTDVKIIRQMSLLKSLDLTNAQIVSGGEAYGNVNGLSLYTSNDVIGREMFYKKEIEVIYLPNEITTIGQDAFGWCRNLKEVRMGNKVTIIETNAFSVCSSLENITLSNKIKHLGNGAFSSSHIKTINLSNDLEYIGPNCFNDCYYLTSVTIPENTNTIGERAFNGCFALKEVHIKAQPQTLSNVGENLFSYFTSSGTDNSLYEKAVLYIPIGSKSYYNTTDFGRFANIVEE